MPVILATVGSIKLDCDPGCPRKKKQDFISKITRAKMTGGTTQEVEHLPTKCEVLSSNLSSTKK
jgi:hypothetical protein